MDDLGFLDKAPLLDCLQRTALGNAGDAGSLLALNGTLSLLVWLTQERARAGDGIGGRLAHGITEPAEAVAALPA